MKTLYTYKNKRANAWINRYWNSNDTRLEDVYKTWSFEKQLAYDYCIKKMHEEEGRDLRIISHNLTSFTVGWITKARDYRIETESNSYLVIDMPF